MSNTDDVYIGCPVQHARQFIAGKWQIGILWNLSRTGLTFGEMKTALPGLSDKILTQELEFFIQKKMIVRTVLQLPTVRAEYTLSQIGQSIIPAINSIVEWGYTNLQDERVTNEMHMTPMPAIEAIESAMREEE